MSHWRELIPGIWQYSGGESCSVYAVVDSDQSGAVVIDSGTGAWLNHLHELPANVCALLCTHYFRDHSAGAALAAARGIPVYVPEYERAIFENPQQHFAERETYIIYDNLWDLFAPVTPTRISGVLQDYDSFVEPTTGLCFQVLPLPGATISQIGLGFEARDGSRVVFCGETVHSKGKVPRIAPLQYNYNDLPGASNVCWSALELRAYRADVLLPSLGEPILGEIDETLIALIGSMRSLLQVREGKTTSLDHLLQGPALVRVTDHVWLDGHSVANTCYIISESGKALAIDYGYHSFTCANWQSYPRPARRRALLHGLDGLKRQFGISQIDVVLVSHFHDDHVCGIPVLQRVYGTQCWAAQNFADLLAFPEAHCFPCCWPVAAKVDRRLPLDQTFKWEEYSFTLHSMNGHTRFATLIGFEADGKKFAHTGDQYFFYHGADDFERNRRAQNHVFRNGALMNGYVESGKWMLPDRPDIVVQGHQPAFFTDAAFFKHISEWTEDYAETARRAMPLDADEPHFDLDSWGGWIWPYRTHLTAPAPFEITVTMRNPLPREAVLEVVLTLPDGWEAPEASIVASSRAEASITLQVQPSGACKRQPIAAALTVEGKPYGQVAEALVTIGESCF